MKDIILALVTRALFIAHALIAIWRAYSEYNNITMWLLLVPVGVLILEALFTVGARGGEEYKWISPCVILYLASVIPSIWFLEMKNYEKRQTRHLCNDLHWGLTSTPGCVRTFRNGSNFLPEEYVDFLVSNTTLRKEACEREYDYLEELRKANNGSIPTTTTPATITTEALAPDGAVGNVLETFNEGKKAIDNLMENINFFNETTWVLVLHQLLLFILIVGRWLLPTGEGISRDQLSQLLLVFIGVGADILEFVTETIKEIDVRCDKLLVIIIMGFWSWSTLQFSLVLTATKARRTRAVGIYEGDEESDEPVVVVEEEDKPGRCMSFLKNMEVWGIFSTLILQDGPFLATRLYIMIGRGVVHQMIVFFTTKNALVVILQIYRLIIIAVHKPKDDEEDESGIDISALEALGGAMVGKASNKGMPEEQGKNGTGRNESKLSEKKKDEKVKEVNEVTDHNASTNNNTSIAYVNIPRSLLP